MRVGGKLSLIEQIADLCQASATLAWHTTLVRALALIAEAAHATDAAPAPRATLTLLDENQTPITRFTFPPGDAADWASAWTYQMPPAPAPPFARVEINALPDPTRREALERVLPLLTPVIHSAALERSRAAPSDAAAFDRLSEERFTHLLTQLTQVIPNDAGDVILLQEGKMQVVGHVGSPRIISSADVAAGDQSGDSVPLHPVERQILAARMRASEYEPLIVCDTIEHPAWTDVEEHFGYRSYAAVPILSGGDEVELLGFICVKDSVPAAFEAHRTEPLQRFAAYAGVILQTLHRYRHQQLHAEDMALLTTVSSLLTMPVDFYSAVQRALELLQEHLDAAAAWVKLLNVKDGELCATYISTVLSLAEARALSFEGEAPSPAETSKLQDYQRVLLVVEDDVIGYLYLGWENAAHSSAAPRSAEATFLTSFGSALAADIDRAVRFKESQQRQRNLERMNTMMSTLNETDTLPKILDVGLEQALLIAEMDRGAIYLWDEREQGLTLRAHHEFRAEGAEPPEVVRGQEDLVGEAFAAREVRVDRFCALGSEQDHAHVCLPLIANDQPVGVMSLQAVRCCTLTPLTSQFLRTITYQLALAVQRGQLTSQMHDQVETLHYLYQMSAAFVSQVSTPNVIFILLRMLTDVVEGVLAAGFYRYEEGWHRTRVYVPPIASPQLRARWHTGQPWTGESAVLDACWQGRQSVRVGQYPASTPALEAEIKALSAEEMIYLPLSLPNQEALGVVGALLDAPRSLKSHELILTSAIIQQASAALSRAQLYEASRESEIQMQAILESSADGLFLVGNDLSIRYINSQAQRMLAIGDVHADWEGHSLPELIAALRYTSRELADYMVELTRNIWEMPSEARPNFKTQQNRILKLQHWAVDAENRKVQGALFVLRDVTEQQALERMRDDILHMLVHDMRNPLSVLKNALDFLRDPKMRDASDEVIEIATGNTDRLLNLVNQILEIGKLEADRFELRYDALILSEHVRRLLSRFTFPNQGRLKVEVNIPQTLQPLWGDATVIVRIFENILNNALKFIPEKEGCIRITAREKGPWVEVMVFNNGPPIEPETYARLFQKFSPGASEKRGYGLGLAFCRLAVEAHGGKIWAENLEEGVAFFFTLPTLDRVDL
jgi:two-component system, NtrC family, sensor histidine kinase KinB